MAGINECKIQQVDCRLAVWPVYRCMVGNKERCVDSNTREGEKWVSTEVVLS